MLENIAFGARAVDAALEEDNLCEDNDGESYMNEDIGRARIGC